MHLPVGKKKNKNVTGCGVAKHIDQKEESRWHLGTELFFFFLHHSKSEKHGKCKDQFTYVFTAEVRVGLRQRFLSSGGGAFLLLLL